MNKSWRSSSFTTIGLDLVLSVMLGLFGGQWLDRKFDTAPWLQVTGLLFGVAAGFSAVFRGWKQMSEATAREEREEGNPRPRYGPDERPRRRDDGSAYIDGGDSASNESRSNADDDRA